jgi:hypothetical protein
MCTHLRNTLLEFSVFHRCLSGRHWLQIWICSVVRGGAGGWGTAVQAGRWRVRSVCTMALGSTQPLTETSTLPPSCAVCLEMLGASTSWSPQHLSSTVHGELS